MRSASDPRLPAPRRERISFCKEPACQLCHGSQAVPGRCSSSPSGVASQVEIKPGKRNGFCLICCLSSSPIIYSVFQLANKEATTKLPHCRNRLQWPKWKLGLRVREPRSCNVWFRVPWLCDQERPRPVQLPCSCPSILDSIKLTLTALNSTLRACMVYKTFLWNSYSKNLNFFGGSIFLHKCMPSTGQKGK